ncbi:MAG: tyrosine-type recombinase/integrase [Firmicutes bacterium]|nr:tyrosine-type recombinase/integrase [Bacillota bacterium]
MKTTDPIKKKNDIRRMREYYLKKGEYRNFLLISFGLNTGLRMCDILSLRVEDIFDFQNRVIRDYIQIKEKKTGKAICIRINAALKKDIRTYFREFGKVRGRFLFESNRGNKAISRIQAYRIIKKAALMCKIQGRIGCHSLRKTFGYFAWKSGVQPVLLMNLFNHSSFEITKRYLGIGQEERDSVYMSLSY